MLTNDGTGPGLCAGAGARIVVEGLTCRYPGADRPALAGVDLVLESGRYYAVLGRNGSGKSTLVRCLNGLIAPTGGRVVSCGFDTGEAGAGVEVKKRLAMVFQDPDTSMVGITVEEEVAFGPENIGLPPAVIRKRVDSALGEAGIAHLAGRQPARLSQGQKQLVAVAGALAMEPSFLLSDESTSMLDQRSRSKVLDVYAGLARSGRGVVHVTHFLEEAVSADAVIVLDAGRVAAFGPPRAVLGDPAAVESMGLEPLPVTRVARELELMGHPAAAGALTVKELVSWLSP